MILKLATDYFFNKFKGYNLLAEIKIRNDKSIKVFENVGFKFFNYLIKNNHNALVYEKKIRIGSFEINHSSRPFYYC